MTGATDIEPWADGPVPAENMIRGFHSVTLASFTPRQTEEVFELFGYEPTKRDDDWMRYRAASDRATHPDRLVKAEAPRWNAFEGLADWTVKQPQADGDSLLAQQRDNKGEQAGEWDYRLKPLVTRFMIEYSQEFTEPLPLLNDDAPTSKDKVTDGYGYWVVIHYLMAQAGYDWYDENDACLTAMQNRVKSIAAYRSAEAARGEYERLLSEWESHREDLEE